MEQMNEENLTMPAEVTPKKKTKKLATANIVLFSIAAVLEAICLYVLISQVLLLKNSGDASAFALIAILPYYIVALAACIAITIPMVIIAICAFATAKKRNARVSLVVWLLPLISIVMIIILFVSLNF